MIIAFYIAFFYFVMVSFSSFASEPDYPNCSGSDQWAASTVGVRLKNLNFSKQAGGYDKVDVKLLASEQRPEKRDRAVFRQVHEVTIHDQGNIFVAVAVNDASHQECSESGVDVYFISVKCGADSECRTYQLP